MAWWNFWVYESLLFLLDLFFPKNQAVWEATPVSSGTGGMAVLALEEATKNIFGWKLGVGCVGLGP